MEPLSPGPSTLTAGSPSALAAPREPRERAGHWTWQSRVGNDHFLFVGKATSGVEDDVWAELDRAGVGVATLRQKHSRRVVEVEAAGEHGEADALVTTSGRLALRVVTADCVPILLSSPERIAAVHAGWRGLRDGIVAAAARRLGAAGPRRAIIGPAIGPCCYEVGEDVASEVAARVGSADVIRWRGAERRPHLDLPLAARIALVAQGFDEVAIIDVCTRCEPRWLWSYRRDGRGAGRNLAVMWRET